MRETLESKLDICHIPSAGIPPVFKESIPMRETMNQILAGRDAGRDGAANADLVPRPRLIANNTVEYYCDGCRVIRLHQTDILKWSKDGRQCRIYSGGWQTVTTKDRINTYSPIRISSKRGLWYIGETLFFDGISIVDGKASLPPKASATIERKATKLAESIRKFVAKLDKLDALPMPNNGDCMYCSMLDNPAARVPPAECKGFKSHDLSHLRSHIAEGYLTGSLIVLAMRWAGETDTMIRLVLNTPRYRDTAKRSLRRFLRSQLGLPA